MTVNFPRMYCSCIGEAVKCIGHNGKSVEMRGYRSSGWTVSVWYENSVPVC